jgi:hypothetical protein
MARLFMEHQRTQYEKRFRPDKTAFWVDQRGNVLGATAKTNLVLTGNSEESARRQRIMQEAGERRREARQRKFNSAAIAEADRTARRIKLLKGAGMTENEAQLAARGHQRDTSPLM